MFASMQMSMASESKFNNKEHAISVARDAIHMAIAKFKSGDLEFRDDIKRENTENHTRATLTFEDKGAPYSTNNIVSSSGAVGWGGQLVPPKSAHLVAVGEAGTEKQVLEIIIHQESFPWSVASNGTIQGNDMEVFAINGKEEADGGFTDGEKLKSNILSNSAGGSGGNSIELSGNSVVTGDAKAVAGINLIDASVVQGKLQANADAVNITLDKRAEDYRPPTGESLVFDPSSPAPITGRYEASGNTVIGDLKFEDGMLFVDGNLTVTGKIEGVGALVATGNITVTGSMNTSADLAALVAGGDINITGVGPNTSSFQGLILAEGSFRAKDTTLVGSALTLDQDGSVELERVRSVAAKDLTKIDLNYAVELKEATESYLGVLFNNGEKIVVDYKGSLTEVNPANYASLETLAKHIKNEGGSSQMKVLLGDGELLDSPPSGAPYELDFLASKSKWKTYVDQVKNNSVVYVDVFQLDFNKFLKTKGGFRPLLQRVTSL